jgi:hypothetical protein
VEVPGGTGPGSRSVQVAPRWISRVPQMNWLVTMNSHPMLATHAAVPVRPAPARRARISGRTSC